MNIACRKYKEKAPKERREMQLDEEFSRIEGYDDYLPVPTTIYTHQQPPNCKLQT